MEIGRWKRGKSLEERLRDERPQPSERFVRSIVAGLAPRRSRHGRSLTFGKFAVTAAVAVALFAIGGLGFAATSFTSGIGGVVHHFLRLNNTHVRTIYRGAADAQYGTTSTTPTTTSGTTTNPSTGAVQASVAANSTGSVSATPPGSSTPVATLLWTAKTFSQPVSVTVDPSPTLPSTLHDAKSTAAVSITIANLSGSSAPTLSAPLEIVLPKNTGRSVPMVEVNGQILSLQALPGTTLLPGEDAGYYVGSDGNFHILVSSLTSFFGKRSNSTAGGSSTITFLATNRRNATESETGRKLAKPGSHRWGDPELVRPGSPKMRVLKRAVARNGNRVVFRMYTNEQVKVLVSIRSGHKTIPVSGERSFFRGHRIGGRNSRTVHGSVLRRLGSLTVNLYTTKPLPRNATVRVTFVDFDGNRVTKTLRIKK